jgi:hypothetical protein
MVEGNNTSETAVAKGKWIGVKPNEVNNSEVCSRYVENAPPTMAFTDNTTNPPTSLT